jgi:hypothetical protein
MCPSKVMERLRNERVQAKRVEKGKNTVTSASQADLIYEADREAGRGASNFVSLFPGSFPSSDNREREPTAGPSNQFKRLLSSDPRDFVKMVSPDKDAGQGGSELFSRKLEQLNIRSGPSSEHVVSS